MIAQRKFLHHKYAALADFMKRVDNPAAVWHHHTSSSIEEGVDVVGCPGCGEYVGVEYDVVEEHE